MNRIFFFSIKIFPNEKAGALVLKTEKLKEREDKASVKKDRSSQEGQGQFLTKTENTVRTREVEELLETQKKMSQRELAVWVWG